MLGFFLLLGFSAKMSINIQPFEHIKCSYGLDVNKRLFFFFLSFLLFFFFAGFFEQWALLFFFFLSCYEQCCLFEFSSLAVILKHSFRFINSMPYLMGDPLHPFVSALMTLVLKEIPFISLDIKHFLPFPFFTASSPSNTLTHLL